MRNRLIGLVLAVLELSAGVGAAAAAEQGKKALKEELFLMKTAQTQKGEVALGKLAARRASSEEVKQFGRKMIEDYEKANQEIRRLAYSQGVELPTGIAARQKEKAEHFSQLSGKEFDRAYIGYMLWDHIKDVVEFEHDASELKNPQVKQWARKTLPTLKEHLTIAKHLADAFGVDERETRTAP